VAGSPTGWQLCGSQKGGESVGVGYKGKGSTVVVVCDAQGLPLGLTLGSAAENERQQGQRAVDDVRVPRRRGRPRKRPERLIADKGFSSAAFRAFLRARHIVSVIPAYRRGSAPKGAKPVKVRPKLRLPRIDPLLYAQRWPVERTFAWMDNFRRLIVRHERSLARYRAFCILAFILFSLARLLK